MSTTLGVVTRVTTGMAYFYFNFQNKGVATIVYMENYGKPEKDKASPWKSDFGSESWLRVGKVL